MSASEKLAKLLEKKNQLLSMYPQLKPLQAEIDRVLKFAGTDPKKRVKALVRMLEDHLENELAPALKDLVTHLEKLREKVKKKKGA